MQDGSEEVELCIASADELILHPGVDVEEMASVLSGVVHHVGGQRSDPPVSLELENNSSSNIDNISTDQLELFVRLEAAVVREEVSQGQSG